MKKRECGKRIFAGRVLALAVVLLLALGLCACGKKGGGKDSTGSSTGGSGQGSSGGAADGNGEQTAGDRLWVEILDKDGVKIYLKDEAVGLTEPGESVDMTNPNEANRSIGITFMHGDDRALRCFLTDKLIGYASPSGATSDEPRKSTYADNTVSWEIHHPGLVGILQQCDHVNIKYFDYDKEENNRTILELAENKEVTALLGDFVMPGSGIKLGFDGNFMSVRISGDEYVKPGEGFKQSLVLNKEGGMHEDGIRITFSFRADGALYHERIDNFQYESDGWVLDAGWTAKQAPLFLWHEDDGENFTVWYYAPGFREALEGMDTYGFGYDTDANQHVTQCEGSLAQIMGDYAAYKTPVQALPAEFIGDAKAGDEKYFTPLTPYYTVMRYDYPEISRTTNWRWWLVDDTHMGYCFMSLELDVTSMTEIVLSSYNSLGEPVQYRFKYIYEDEESAIRTNVDEHQSLQTATGTTYGTEEDFAQWIYDRFTGVTGDGDRAKILLSHEGNVVYTSRSIQGKSENLNFSNGEPNVTETGSFVYSYSYGRQGGGNEIIRNSTCTYKGYRTFDRRQVTEAAQKPR